MKRAILYIFSILLIPALGTAQTVQSIADGSALSTTTWDCGCIPGSTSDVIVNHTVELVGTTTYGSLTINSGGVFRNQTSGYLVIDGNVDIQTGGVFSSKKYVVIKGDFNIDGTWSGDQSVDMRGASAALSGTGTISNTATLYFRTGDKVIQSGTELYKKNGIISIRDVTVENRGSIRTSVFTSSGSKAKWVQKANSRLEVVSIMSGTVKLFATAKGNTVAFTRDGTHQDIWPAQSSTFHNLELSSNNSKWRKYLKQDLIIKGDLKITDCRVDTKNGTTIHDLEIQGNWNANGGYMLPKTNTVTFTNTSDITISTDVVEQFNILNLNGTGTVTFAGDAKITGDFTFNTPIIMDAAQQRTITVGGDWLNNASYTANGGKVVMDGSSAQVISGEMTYYDLEINNTAGGVDMINGDQTVHGTLTITSGDLNTADRLLMVSDENGDSRIAEIVSGSITGEVTAQRYIDAGATNWRFLTSPTQNNTIGDWTDDFNTSGFTGSTWPTFSFTSIYFHDEAAPGTLDDGFIPATDVSDPILPGQGIWVWCGDSLQGTSPFTIDVKGDIYQGNIDLPVTYTSYGNPADDGWNMVANPYVSAIDWESLDWTKTNISNAIYIWVPELQQFAAYVNGSGVNGGSRYIASSQAFWVQTTGPSPQLTATEAVKSASAIGFKSITQPSDDVLMISMNRNGLSDQLVLKYNDGSTSAFDNAFDAIERYSPTTTAPNFNSVSSDGAELMINTFPKPQADTTIQLHFTVNQGGDYVISFEELNGRFSSSCLVLVDQLFGTETAVREGDDVTVTLSAGQQVDRFQLRISGAIEHSETATTCPGASDGMAIAQATGTGPWEYTWLNDVGTVIRNSGPVNGPDTLQGMIAGRYFVEVDMGASCGLISAEVQIPDAAPIAPGELISNATCAAIADGSIELNLPGGNQGYSIQWSNGSTGNVIDNLYPGEYDVQVSDQNGCSTSFSFTVDTDMEVIAAFSAPIVGIVQQAVTFQSNAINSSSIHWDMGDGTVYTDINAPMHQYEEPGTYTVTMTATNGSCVDVATNDIVIEKLATGVNDLISTGGITFQQSGDQLFLVNDGRRARALTVQITNVVGQLIVEPFTRKFEVGKTQLDIPNVRGTVLVISAFDNETGERFGKRIMF